MHPMTPVIHCKRQPLSLPACGSPLLARGAANRRCPRCSAATSWALGHPVLAIDADINQHLGAALGLADDVPPHPVPMGEHLPRDQGLPARGKNPRIPSAPTR